MSARPRVGVSSCLLGELVRYDGKEKGVDWVREVLSVEVELVPMCPEVGAGMPVPRPPIQVAVTPEGERLIQLVSGSDDVHTPLAAFCDRTRSALERAPVHGYLFKARSPSCGVVDTPHFAADGAIAAHGAGLWAQTVVERWPDLPVADEGDVADAEGRRCFLGQVRDYWHRHR